jgi:hypothetical protein
MRTLKFESRILKIGVNPYVLLPVEILEQIFKAAGKIKGPIPVKGKLNGKHYTQTLVKYSGKWRLYLNGVMRVAAGIDVGENAKVEIAYDPVERITEMHPDLEAAFRKHKKAFGIFSTLPPSRQKEIKRYINALKTEESREKNIARAIRFLQGGERFIGRDKP